MAATPVYACPSGWSLSGTTCTTSTSAPATVNASCNGLGAPFTYSGFPACRDDVAAQMGEYEDEGALCMDVYGGHGLEFVSANRKSNKLVSCVFRAVVTYSCPANTSLSGANCIGSSSQAATIGSYSCPSGSLSGSTCVATSSYGAWVSSYFCNPGDALSGSTCTRTTTSSYAATPVYACNAGDSLSGTTCTRLGSGTYPATPSGYACNSGDVLSGATCTHTTQAAATPVYGCSSGTLSGTSCVGGTTLTRTAYVYLGRIQIAETSEGVTQFAHTDALGSPVAHTNAAGAVLNRTRYEPYGYTAQGKKPGTAGSSIGFTGHVNDADTDLVYMQQRYYDPIAARFLSVDPVTTNASTGKAFGRYQYADDNPYKLVDPDGREPQAFIRETLPGGSLYGLRTAWNRAFGPDTPATTGSQAAMSVGGSAMVGPVGGSVEEGFAYNLQTMERTHFVNQCVLLGLGLGMSADLNGSVGLGSPGDGWQASLFGKAAMGVLGGHAEVSPGIGSDGPSVGAGASQGALLGGGVKICVQTVDKPDQAVGLKGAFQGVFQLSGRLEAKALDKAMEKAKKMGEQ